MGTQMILRALALPTLAALMCTGIAPAADQPDVPAGDNTKIPENILTPNRVETSIGTLEFIDGAPLPTPPRRSTTISTLRGRRTPS